MITYSTNWMGPISMAWFRERGLTRQVSVVLEEGRTFYPKGLGPGDVWEYDEITTQYSAGRIDIRGVPDEPWGLEYGVAPMHDEDWNAFSEYLWDLKTEELVPYNTLIEQFETHYGKRIRWADVLVWLGVEE